MSERETLERCFSTALDNQSPLGNPFSKEFNPDQPIELTAGRMKLSGDTYVRAVINLFVWSAKEEGYTENAIIRFIKDLGNKNGVDIFSNMVRIEEDNAAGAERLRDKYGEAKASKFWGASPDEYRKWANDWREWKRRADALP